MRPFPVVHFQSLLVYQHEKSLHFCDVRSHYFLSLLPGLKNVADLNAQRLKRHLTSLEETFLLKLSAEPGLGKTGGRKTTFVALSCLDCNELKLVANWRVSL